MKNWVLILCIGIGVTLAGILALAHPFAASLGVEIFTGWMFLISGIVTVVAAFLDKETGGRIWTIILGIILGLIGVSLLANPLKGIIALVVLMTMMLAISGLVKLYFAFKIHDNTLK